MISLLYGCLWMKDIVIAVSEVFGNMFRAVHQLIAFVQILFCNFFAQLGELS